MANATYAIEREYVSEVHHRVVKPTKAAVKPLQGTFATEDSSGNVGPRTDNERFAGIVNSTVDNSAGAAAASGKETEVDTILFLQEKVTGVVVGDEGKAVFLGSDDYSLSLTPKAKQYVGKIHQVPTAGVAVIKIDEPGAHEWSTRVTLADDATLVLPVQEGLVTVIGGNEVAIISTLANGTCASVAASTNVAVADTDAKLCVFNNSGVPTLKNRLGAEKTFTIKFAGVQ